MPLHKEAKPGIAKTTNRLLRSMLSPKEGAAPASPSTCMEGPVSRIVKDTLKKRRSERIKKAVAVAKARPEEAKLQLWRPERAGATPEAPCVQIETRE